MSALALPLALMTSGALAFTIDDLAPYHLAPADHFTIELGGIALNAGDAVQVTFTHVGSMASSMVAAESIDVAEDSIGVRVPPGAALGQHDVTVTVNAVANSGAAGNVWVRNLPFSLIRESSGNLPSQPAPGDAHYKDSDFGDVDNDGFLDVFEAISQEGMGPANNDRLYINQLGKAVRDCPGTSVFCNQTATQFEQSPPMVPNNNRTYDADLADIDLDSDVDIVRIDQAGNAALRILINDGSGNFDDRTLDRVDSLATLTSVIGRGAEVDLGDADGDGRPDLLICNWDGSRQVGLLINELDTSGRFELVNDDPCNPADAGAHALCQARDQNNRGCAFGQFDGVGGIDIILPTINSAQGDLVLLHTGNVGNVPQYSVESGWVVSSMFGVPAGGSNGDVKVADLDGDNDDDVVVTAPQDGASARRRILWNDNHTRLVELDASRYPDNNNDYDASIADLDRDGDLDLMFGDRFNGFGPVLINKGGRNQNMRFDATGANFWLARSPGGVVPAPGSVDFGLSVAPGDYDLDGDIDLLTGGFSRMGLWSNDLFQQPGQARDWVFILDKTRSMVSATRDFFEPARNVLATFSTQRRDDDAVGFVTFDYTGPHTGNPNAPDDVNKAQRVVEVGDQDFFTLAETIRDTDLGTCSGRCTAIGWAIHTGNEMAADAPVPDPANPREQILVLATDGRQNQAPHPDTIIPNLPAHVRLYTIALGSDTDDRMLSALATNGGKFYFAGRSDDYTSVQNSLREVNNDLEAHATARQALLPLQELIWAKSLVAVLSESPIVTRVIQRTQLAIDPSVVVGTPTRQVFLFLVDPADRQVRFTLSWRNPDRTVALRVTDPRGQVVDPATDIRARLRSWTRAQSIRIEDPLSGVWLVERIGGGDLGPVKATGMASSLLTVVGEGEHPRFYLDDALVVNLVVADGTAPVPGARGEARCTSPGEQVRNVTAQADSAGRLRLDCGPAAEEGSWKVEVTVFGPTDRPFVRTWQEAFHVATATPDELDLRTAELSLDKTVLSAGGADTATATLRISARDGSPKAGETVRFLVTNGSAQGTVSDHGDGSYSQAIAGGAQAGPGAVRARVGIEQLRNRVDFEVTAGPVDPAQSTVDVYIGPLRLCTNQIGTFAVRVNAFDSAENAIEGADVAIEQTAGAPVTWAGPVADLGGGGYERRFEVPQTVGTVAFGASVDGVPVTGNPDIDVFDPASPEGIAAGCSPGETPPAEDWRWLWWLLLILLILAVLWWLLRR